MQLWYIAIFSLFNLKIIYYNERADGMPKKFLDITLAKMYVWKPTNDLDKGFDATLKDFVKNR